MTSDVAAVAAASAARLRAIDPLVGSDVDGAPDEGEHLVVGGAHGWAAVTDLDPSAALAQWGRLRTYGLRLRWDGADPRHVERLLARFRAWSVDHRIDEAGEESQVSIAWPARDVSPAQAFIAHGLAPSVTVAVRPHGRPLDAAPMPEGITIRRATAADAPAVRAATIDEARYDEHHASTRLRAGFEEARLAELRESLAGDPWTWLAETADGSVLGVVELQTPDQAWWAAGIVAVSRPAYLVLGHVVADHRGGGIGHALVARAVDEGDAAGVPATLLHHVTANPLSAPFWSRMGWRPLWRSWQVWPAAHLR